MKLTLILIPLLFLSSCTIDWNDEKDKKIENLNAKIEELNAKIEIQKEEIKKVKDDEIFKKNQECSKYLSKMENLSVGKGPGRIFNNGVYFSKTLNSCIYMEKVTYLKGSTSGDIDFDECYKAVNTFTNEMIINPSCTERNSNTEWDQNLKTSYNKLLADLQKGN